jgi:hypothetical protein
VALGVAVGAVVKRVLPALATTLVVFVGVRVAIGVYLRPHYLTPVSKLYPLSNTIGPPSGSWVVSNSFVGPDGHLFGYGFSSSNVPAACRSDFLGGKVVSEKCMTDHGFHQLFTFQPASRFWAFQGIEAAIFVVLAIALVAFAFRWVLTRDA